MSAPLSRSPSIPRTGCTSGSNGLFATCSLSPPTAAGSGPGRDSSSGGAVRSLLEAGYADWQLRTAAELEQVLDSTEHDALRRWSDAVWRCAREAFSDIARPYTTSSRYAPRYAAALSHLTPWSVR